MERDGGFRARHASTGYFSTMPRPRPEQYSGKLGAPEWVTTGASEAQVPGSIPSVAFLLCWRLVGNILFWSGAYVRFRNTVVRCAIGSSVYVYQWFVTVYNVLVCRSWKSQSSSHHDATLSRIKLHAFSRKVRRVESHNQRKNAQQLKRQQVMIRVHNVCAQIRHLWDSNPRGETPSA